MTRHCEISAAIMTVMLSVQVALGVAHRQAAAAQTQPAGALVKRFLSSPLPRCPATSSQSRPSYNRHAILLVLSAFRNAATSSVLVELGLNPHYMQGSGRSARSASHTAARRRRRELRLGPTFLMTPRKSRRRRKATGGSPSMRRWGSACSLSTLVDARSAATEMLQIVPEPQLTAALA